MNSNGLQGWFWVGFFLTHKAAICTDIFKDFIYFLILSCLIIRITYVPKLQYIFLNFYQFWIRFRSVKSFQNFQHRCKKQKFKSIWTEGPHFLKIRIFFSSGLTYFFWPIFFYRNPHYQSSQQCTTDFNPIYLIATIHFLKIVQLCFIIKKVN